MKLFQSEIVEKKSMYRGLDELQQHFLREETRKDSRRSSATLRRIAKKKAIIQRLKWIFGESVTVIGLIGFIAAVVLSIVVIFYRG
ncbi:hypothetical protein ACFPOG_20650 [Paenibacillus aestuarii]|uniref:Uncharacterized protein n=1 Tax=Paenibacillus aestuarii TaxID=516965 RepID=A0ABW0KD32_9BACL